LRLASPLDLPGVILPWASLPLAGALAWVLRWPGVAGWPGVLRRPGVLHRPGVLRRPGVRRLALPARILAAAPGAGQRIHVIFGARLVIVCMRRRHLFRLAVVVS
jgi:hypothetical protein